MRFSNISAIFFGLTTAGCVVGCTVDDNDAIAASSDLPDAKAKLAGLDTVQAYFNHDNHYALDGQFARVYAKFNSYAGKGLTVTLRQRPEDAGSSVGFNLYEVAEDGSLGLLNTFDGPGGEASTAFESQGTGSYVAELRSSSAIADVVLNLSCKGERCVPEGQPSDVCGGRTGLTCAKDLYCAYDLAAMCGAFDSAGHCAEKPEQCNQIYAPVCGCDGLTYSNSCRAARAGVSIKSEQACPVPVAQENESCGGFRRGPIPVCAQGLYCSYKPGDVCGRADAPGVCAQIPASCAQTEEQPVCGCDDKTYPNECLAALNGVALLSSRACDHAYSAR